jgi:hypothetical protein
MNPLPTEIIQYIIYLSGLDTAIKCKNDFIVKKILKDKYFSWEDIIYNCNGATLEYLYNNNIHIQELKEFQKSFIPGCHVSIFNSAIEKRDILKMKIIEKILPKSVIDNKAFEYAKNLKYNEIIEWCKINRPVMFGSFYTKQFNVKFR